MRIGTDVGVGLSKSNAVVFAKSEVHASVDRPDSDHADLLQSERRAAAEVEELWAALVEELHNSEAGKNLSVRIGRVAAAQRDATEAEQAAEALRDTILDLAAAGNAAIEERQKYDAALARARQQRQFVEDQAMLIDEARRTYAAAAKSALADLRNSINSDMDKRRSQLLDDVGQALQRFAIEEVFLKETERSLRFDLPTWSKTPWPAGCAPEREANAVS